MRPTINYTELKQCIRSDLLFFHPGDNGVTCHKSEVSQDYVCKWAGEWCYDSVIPTKCNAGIDSEDPVLCSNRTFWKDIPCNGTVQGVTYVGERCIGDHMQCYWPAAPAWTKLTQTCIDFSDRIYQQKIPCPSTPNNICWDSCANPGPQCTTCTNTTYFQCSQSKKCIHPSLKCDGHPQCDFGEDEDLDICKYIYPQNDGLRRHQTQKYATFRCHRIMYPELETYATPCDGYTHCLNGEDESLCSDDSTLNIILALIALLYLALKFWRITLYKICIKQNQEELQLKKSRKGRNRKKVLEKYQNNNENTSSFNLH